MKKKLSKEAYGGVKGEDYKPYVEGEDRSGGNIIVLIIGIFLAALFAASTAYSGMKSGLTVAAGIPGSIIGSGLVTLLAKKKGILGKNLIQGMSSGGESIASGLIFVIPSILLIGSSFTFFQGLIVGISGVLFGIGVSELVYNVLIVEEHGNLKYPESMAISETLVASEAGGDSLKFMGIGFGLGGVLTLLSGAFFNIVNTVISFGSKKGYKWNFGLEVNPMLLGIGFIVGLEVSLMMFAGSMLSSFGITPLIAYFTEFANNTATVWNDSSLLIKDMSVGDISGNYVRYIGAGMMLCGGFIGAIKLIPTIISSVKQTLGNKSSNSGSNGSFGIMILFSGVILGFVGAFLISSSILMAIVGALFGFVLSFLFVIVAGRLTGTIGTSNLPVSGMTIASLVIVTLVFVISKWTTIENNTSLLLFGSFIVVAIATAGGYSQSQKVTFVVGGKKDEMAKYFAMAAITGVVAVIGTIIILTPKLKDTVNPEFALPQANLIATLTSGIISGDLPWVMIISGIVIAIVLYLFKLPIMTIAVGFYLPISTTSIILVGALIRVVVEFNKNKKEVEKQVSNGISLSSGLVAGGSIIGLIGIILQVLGVIGNGSGPQGFGTTNTMAAILLGLLVVLVTVFIKSSKSKN